MAYEKSKLNAKKQKRRASIMDAAITVIAKKGFHKTKIIDIAREANVADGTIYLYFENKDDLLIKIFVEILELHLSELKAAIEPIESKVEKLRKFFYVHEEIFKDRIDELNFFAMELHQSPEFYKIYPDFNPFAEYRQYLMDLCVDAVNSGEIRKIDPAILMNILFGTLEYTLIQWASDKIELDIKEVIEQSIDLIHNGLAK